MDNQELQEALTALGVGKRFLQQRIRSLGRKKVTKRDPYDALHSFLLHLYCLGDKQRFRTLFERFVGDEMDTHFDQDFSLWYFIECAILYHGDLLDDSQFDHFISDKGFVAERLQGSMLKVNSRNLSTELEEVARGHVLPKETVLRRYQSLICECLLIIRFKKTGLFGSYKKTKADLERYRRLYLAMEEHFDASDEETVACLKDVSSNLV